MLDRLQAPLETCRSFIILYSRNLQNIIPVAVSFLKNKKPPAGIDQPDGGFIVSAEITILFNCLDENTPVLIGYTLVWL